MNVAKSAAIIANAALLLLNYYIFKKLRKQEPKEWFEYEEAFFRAYLFKKIGLEPTLLFFGVLITTIIIVAPFDAVFWFVLGALTNNLIHDFLSFRQNWRDVAECEAVNQKGDVFDQKG